VAIKVLFQWPLRLFYSGHEGSFQQGSSDFAVAIKQPLVTEILKN